ncbi:hypothetical protein NDU88_000715 [Pleurodeles waltl]|uniref:Uncharacterized protein n=1 Tax=Pleurodeles waltl TaxID=8319 RepID=A0AAV7TI23_PLEWA|nr:hypothetical protein NDU88_000715 [Pleurodeles waltl]
MFNNIRRPRKPDPADAAARSGSGRRRGPSVEPSGPAVAAAVHCAQVRRDANAAGGDGGDLRMHPRRS